MRFEFSRNWGSWKILRAFFQCLIMLDGSALDIVGDGKASHSTIVEAVERLVGTAQADAA